MVGCDIRKRRGRSAFGRKTRPPETWMQSRSCRRALLSRRSSNLRRRPPQPKLVAAVNGGISRNPTSATNAEAPLGHTTHRPTRLSVSGPGPCLRATGRPRPNFRRPARHRQFPATSARSLSRIRSWSLIVAIHPPARSTSGRIRAREPRRSTSPWYTIDQIRRPRAARPARHLRGFRRRPIGRAPPQRIAPPGKKILPWYTNMSLTGTVAMAAAHPTPRCFFPESARAALRDETDCGPLGAPGVCDPVPDPRFFAASPPLPLVA